MSNIEYIPLFPQLVTKTDTNPEFLEFRDKFIDYAYELKSKSPGISRSNKKGWHSSTSIINDDDFSECVGFLEKYIAQTVNTLFKNTTKVKIDSCWLNINNKDSENVVHTHPGCHLSGCLWIKSTKDSGQLKIYSEHEFNHHYLHESYTNKIFHEFYTSPRYFFKPTEGHMVMFPSDLKHSVFQNDDPYDRISLAFNITVRPPITEDDKS